MFLSKSRASETALELIQVTISANGAFRAKTDDKLADVIDQVSFVLRNTATQANITVAKPCIS
jgi:hypothetical protein